MERVTKKGPSRLRARDPRAHLARSTGGQVRRPVVAPPELREWLAFALTRERGARATRRELRDSFDVFAASEGYPAMSELALVRHLETLGVRRRGTTFFGVRVCSRIHPLRLLTRLELYGYRFTLREGDLLWCAPEATSDLERRVIARHREELIAALLQIEATRAMLRGQGTLPLGPSVRISRRAA
jgi:hypothetical protein